MQSAKPSDILRDYPYLVVRQRWVELPTECVVCGAAGSCRLKLKIRKASRLCILFGYFGALYYFTRPTARLHAGFCRNHRSPVRTAQWVMRGMLLSALAFLSIAIYFWSPDVSANCSVAVVLLLNAALLYEILRRKPLSIIHADRYYVWLARVSPIILDQFPEIESTADNQRTIEPTAQPETA